MSEELCVGVTMMVERMQTNPEDFEYGGKLRGYTSSIEELLQKPTAHQPFWYLSEAERNALVEAYRGMHKAAFTVNVMQAILSPKSDSDINMDMPYYQRKPSTMIASADMVKQAKELLNQEFEKEYAKRRNP